MTAGGGTLTFRCRRGYALGEMRRALAGLAVATLVSSCSLESLDPFHTQFDDVEPAKRYYRSTPVPAPGVVTTLTVMSWNVKFGGGRIDFFWDCHGDRTNMSRGEVLSNLEALAEKIEQVDPDILLLQEVDVESKRSDYLDQVQWLLDHGRLNEGAYASQWKADYVPGDGIGRVDSGNAVFSRWPINWALRHSLPLIASDDALTNYFYLKRNMLEVSVDLPGLDDFRIVATHTEAYADDGTKKKHVDRFKAKLDELAAEGVLFIAGGDLNTLPPGSEQVSDFPDSVCEGRFEGDDFSEETDYLYPLYQTYEAETPLADYLADNDPYFTFTSDKNGFWSRKLDYLFTNGDFVPGSSITHQDEESGGMETMSRSDHAPISVELDLP